MKETFRAFVVDKQEDSFTAAVKSITMEDLPEGEVTIKVSYSSVNYKDGLASTPDGRIVSAYPFIPGIDLAGTVVSSSDDRYKEGDKVLVTGYELGVSHFGGFSEYARVRADWIVPLPDGLSLKEAMAYGTAGFTAALSVKRLEDHGTAPQNGPVLVTGATGGVGSMAVSILAKKGYEVAASTGKESEHAYLKQLGATTILSREEVSPEKIKTLDKTRWAAAVDPVGGRTLAYLLSSTQYGGAVAVSGMTGGGNVPTTVFPFILRGISLIGIDSVLCPMQVRKKLWDRMAGDLKPEGLVESIAHEISLDDLPQTLSSILQGKVRGRVVVALD
jgi:acrylyl-CoA reductase (NADPH)